MLDLGHLTITKTKPNPKQKLATVSNHTETTDHNTDTVTVADDPDAIDAANSLNSHIQNATYANRPRKKPFSSMLLPFASTASKQCTYKHSTCIQHCLWIYLIFSFCLTKCKYNTNLKMSVLVYSCCGQML